MSRKWNPSEKVQIRWVHLSTSPIGYLILLTASYNGTFLYIYLDKDIKLALTPVSLEALKENYLPSGIGTVKLRGSLIGGYLFCSLV